MAMIAAVCVLAATYTPSDTVVARMAAIKEERRFKSTGCRDEDEDDEEDD